MIRTDLHFFWILTFLRKFLQIEFQKSKDIFLASVGVFVLFQSSIDVCDDVFLDDGERNFERFALARLFVIFYENKLTACNNYILYYYYYHYALI